MGFETLHVKFQFAALFANPRQTFSSLRSLSFPFLIVSSTGIGDLVDTVNVAL